jgi:hypothetical protein
MLYPSRLRAGDVSYVEIRPFFTGGLWVTLNLGDSSDHPTETYEVSRDGRLVAYCKENGLDYVEVSVERALYRTLYTLTGTRVAVEAVRDRLMREYPPAGYSTYVVEESVHAMVVSRLNSCD